MPDDRAVVAELEAALGERREGESLNAIEGRLVAAAGETDPGLVLFACRLAGRYTSACSCVMGCKSRR